MTITLRDGTTQSDHRLGRLPSQNETRLERYPLAAVPGLGSTLRKPFRSYSWRHVQLDQGNQPACTFFSETMEAAARPKPFFGDPVRKPPSVAELNGLALQGYQRCKEVDEWEGTEYEGSSVDAAARVGMERGYSTGYYWATGTPEEIAEQVMLVVAYKGPVKVGSWWRRAMYRANRDGYLEYTGTYDGGHAYLLTRSNVDRDALYTPNSWGGEGAGWLTRATLTEIAREGGEFCFATGRRNQR